MLCRFVCLLAVCAFSVHAAPVDNTALCAVIPPPKAKPDCDYEVLYDARFCVVGYQCAVPTVATEAPPDFELLLRLSEPCPLLDPWTNSQAHPETDLACDTGLPGWEKQQGCTCVYLVNERDQDERCPTSFWRKCTKFNPNGTEAAPCPPIEFPATVPAGCKLFKVTDNKGCANVELDCPKPTEVFADEFVQSNAQVQDNTYAIPGSVPPPPPPPPASASSYRRKH